MHMHQYSIRILRFPPIITHVTNNCRKGFVSSDNSGNFCSKITIKNLTLAWTYSSKIQTARPITPAYLWKHAGAEIFKVATLKFIYLSLTIKTRSFRLDGGSNGGAKENRNLN